MNFCQLHIHNFTGSILDGMASNEEYAIKAKNFGHEYLACTDHGRLTALFNHQEACLKHGIKPIMGLEAYTVDELVTLEEGKTKNLKRVRTKTNHLILLVKNKIGYKNLLKINYLSNKDREHYYYAPRVTKEEVFENSEGLIIGTACMASKFSRLILEDKIEESEKLFLEYLDVFKDDFYAEVQLNELTYKMEKAEFGQKTINDNIINFANKHGVPIVITGDVHYANEGDDKLQTLSMAIKNGDTLDNISFEIEAKNLYYHDVPDYHKFNKEYLYNYTDDQINEWCANSNEIAKRCDYIIPERIQVHLPEMTEDDDAALVRKSREGLGKLFDDGVPKEYSDRLNYELEIIIRKGFASYVLILEDIYTYARSNEDFYFGPGRGCYTEDAMVFTTSGFKKIKDIKIGDTIINEDGVEDKVINTFRYDIDEELYNIDYEYSSNTFSKKTCTGDHKQKIKRGDKIIWEETKNIVPNKDLLCLPKIKEDNTIIKTIDLLEYNDFNYEYDNKYIYEKVVNNKKYPLSIKEVSKKTLLAESVINDYLYNKVNSKSTTIEKIEAFTKMTREEYLEYIKGNKFVIKKVNRFLKIDNNFNRMIGLLAGNGWLTSNNRGIGLAINSGSKKDKWNRNEFILFYDKMFETKDFFYENKSKTKFLSQLYINSKLLNSFFKKEIICYDENKQKYIKRKWLKQNNKALKNIFKGLIYSDGWFKKEYKNLRLSFDNTSVKLISNFCEISNKLGFIPHVGVRKESYSGGYLCKKSYKVRISHSNFGVKNNENYYFTKIKKIDKIEKTKCFVYDLSVENKKSFMIDNMITHNSAAASLILYSLGITTLDPIKYELIFERFMSESRTQDVIYDYFMEGE